MRSGRRYQSVRLRLKPFYAKFVCHRWSDQAAFDAGLEVAGPRAMHRWARDGAVPGRVQVDDG